MCVASQNIINYYSGQYQNYKKSLYSKSRATHNVSFAGGLTKVLNARHFTDPSKVILSSNLLDKNHIVGTLPSEWISKIPKQNREQTIKTFYNNMSQIPDDLRGGFLKFLVPSKVKTKLGNIFHDAGIISSTKALDIKFLWFGVFGRTYKIKSKDFDGTYVLKVFKSKSHETGKHGIMPESHNALYLRKNAGKNSQFTPFHFGDLKEGYMLLDYISKDIKPPSKIVDEHALGVMCEDCVDAAHGHNKINNYVIDYGQIVTKSPKVVTNKHLRYVKQKLYGVKEENRKDVFQRLISKKSPNINEIHKSLAESLYIIPPENSKECFMALYNNCSNSNKKLLAENLLNIRPQDRKDCVELILNNSDEAMKKHLKRFIHFLPSQDLNEIEQKYGSLK